MKITYKSICKFLLLLLYFTSPLIADSNSNPPKIENDTIISQKLQEDLKKIAVTIKFTPSIIAYGYKGGGFGSGFIADAKRGLIVTNAHVATVNPVETYTITLYSGAQFDAKLIYIDTVVDCAVLEVDPKHLPKDLQSFPLSTEIAKIGSKVLVISNSEGIGFSFHQGHISDSYSISGILPMGSYQINLNTKAGCSGSPAFLLDGDKCKIIGLNYGGGESHISALKSEYVKYILDAITQDKIPVRKHCGIIALKYNLSDAVKHRSFPNEVAQDYLKNFPDSKNNIIVVDRIIPGTQAIGILESGDLIWSANGKIIAGDLLTLDMIMNKSTSDYIDLEVYRLGKKLKFKVPLLDVNKTKVNRILEFAGAIFFESDMLYSSRSGIPVKSVVVANIQPGSSFSKIGFYNKDEIAGYRLIIKKIDENKINSFEDLVSVIKSLWQKKKYISVAWENHQFYSVSFQPNFYSSGHEEFVDDVNLSATMEKPRIISFDNKTRSWKIDYIVN